VTGLKRQAGRPQASQEGLAMNAVLNSSSFRTAGKPGALTLEGEKLHPTAVPNGYSVLTDDSMSMAICVKAKLL